MAIRIKSRTGESSEGMLRRFKKLCEKEGLTKDIKRKAFFEKPSERRRRAMRKSIKRVQILKMGLPPKSKLDAKKDGKGPRGGRGGDRGPAGGGGGGYE
ncbi:MAG TPA: 30S ribosomal protein S21 [Phycisphaerales bacterium]|nr:30S ribosomal protein S21 [Phycisphaerales bacterium]